MCTIWTNGEKVVTPAPIPVYFYAKKRLEFDMAQDIVETPENVKLLSDLKEHKVYRYEVPNVEYIKEINKSLNRGGLDAHQRIAQSIFENHIKYIDRILIDQPNFVLKYPNTDELKFFYFDIETLMDNYIDKKIITSIAYATNDREIYSCQGDEKYILGWFLRSIQDIDPDIIVGYYMRDFDLVRIIERCKFHNLDYTKLARDGKVHYFKQDNARSVTMKIGGRVLWDLLDSVNSDQTIYGIKNHRMKTVCQWFGIEGSDWVKVDMTNSANDVDEDTLRSHNEDDIRRTFGLADVYWGNISTLAEMFKAPLDFVINNTQASLAGIFMGRGLLELNIRSDGMNQDRHPEIFRRPNKVKGEGNYEAAMVGIYQPGLHKPLYKIDFAGFYPSLMAAFNLSPDTAKILGYKPYQDEFTSEVIGNKVVYYIPDKVIKKTIIIGVKQDVDGFLRKELRLIKSLRKLSS
jgi:DNA polymerase elongation subunit (family B)